MGEVFPDGAETPGGEPAPLPLTSHPCGLAMAPDPTALDPSPSKLAARQAETAPGHRQPGAPGALRCPRSPFEKSELFHVTPPRPPRGEGLGSEGKSREAKPQVRELFPWVPFLEHKPCQRQNTRPIRTGTH